MSASLGERLILVLRKTHAKLGKNDGVTLSPYPVDPGGPRQQSSLVDRRRPASVAEAHERRMSRSRHREEAVGGLSEPPVVKQSLMHGFQRPPDRRDYSPSGSLSSVSLREADVGLSQPDAVRLYRPIFKATDWA